MRKLILLSGLILFTALYSVFYSCKKDKTTPPVITTDPITERTQTSAISGGNLIEISGANIISRGICWNTSPDPTVANNKTTESGFLGPFISKMTQLTPNTQYWVRAYAISNEVTGYGNQVTFTTLQVSVPELVTSGSASVTQTTATISGNVISDGGSMIIERGVCWNDVPNPEISDNVAQDLKFHPGTDDSGTGNFSVNLTDLLPGTTYYFRAYATNNTGTVYGNEMNFTTEPPMLPLISTRGISDITETTASSGGIISNDGGSPVTARGVCWNVSGSPTTADSKTDDGPGTGSFTSNLTGLTASTTYYVRSYATNSEGIIYGNELDFTTSPSSVIVPTVTTTEATSLTTSSAMSGGNVTNDGGDAVIEYGVCWSTATDPTTDNNRTSDGSGTESFTSSITGLNANTTYYVRAYATNSAGTGYGSSIPFTTKEEEGATVSDKDGNVYHTVNIGTQVWMLENLLSTSLNDGTAIQLVTDATAWGDLETPGYCFPGNDANNKLTNGMLYNWYAVNTCKLCPTGWHVPTDAEWTTLTNYLGGENVAGGKLKETGITHWLSPNEGATNESGFTALPGGDRWYNGTFSGFGSWGYWWSSSQHSESFSWYRSMTNLLAYVDRDYHAKEFGHSIRCIEGEGQVIPVVTTATATEITSTTAKSGGNVTSDGGAAVTVRGVCWDTYPGPTILNSKTTDGSGTGAFVSSISGLTANKTYYLRSYATNSIGTSYGNEISFSTSAASVATLTTTAASSITQNTASSGGTITSDGGSAITVSGVCWSTTTNPSVSGSHTTDGSASGTFTSTITGLTTNTKYYVRSYAINSIGTAYGNELIFTSGSVIPTLTTTTISSITTTTANSGGNISDDGGAEVTSRGVCWSLSANPTIALSTKTSEGSGTGVFTSNITGLTPGSTYYVRAFATSNAGTAYGNELQFSTTAVIPTITTTTISAVTSMSASCGGNISSDGGSPVTAKGVCWSTTTDPTVTLGSKTTDGTGVGNFTSSITGLTPNTTYYVRAYATNSIETAYGNEISFITLAEAPALSTTVIGSITAISASSGGNITDNGGSEVTVRGVCWSTAANPSTALSTKTTDGSGTGIFTSNLTGLTPGTFYYVRAYAINSAGTAYGDQLTFSTDPVLPTLSTTAMNYIASTQAGGGGYITNNGGASITERGICWSLAANPTVEVSGKTSDGTGIGSFSSILTGLSVNTTYYVRAYATNSSGTAYGNEFDFITTEQLVVSHTSEGSVAPVDKTVTYETVFTSLSGTNKLWISQNLGATNQAGSSNDNTEDAAGWYWQFNRKQGYKHDGSTRTPSTSWNNTIDEDSNWTAATDPCTLLLGAGWRIPTSSEWVNADNNGGWTNYNQTFGSALKIHAAGFLWPVTGDLMQNGLHGNYWSSTQVGTTSASRLEFKDSFSILSSLTKSCGLSIRCIKD